MNQFFTNLFKVQKAKEIPAITSFLVNNPVFRRIALAFHKEKVETINEIDDWLEKELLTKEQYDAKYNLKQLNESEKKQSTSIKPQKRQ